MTYPPSSLPTDKTDDTTMASDHAPDHNAISAAVNTIVTMLGTGPQGDFDTLTTRLADLSGANAEYTVVIIASDQDSLTIGNGLTFVEGNSDGPFLTVTDSGSPVSGDCVVIEGCPNGVFAINHGESEGNNVNIASGASGFWWWDGTAWILGGFLTGYRPGGLSIGNLVGVGSIDFSGPQVGTVTTDSDISGLGFSFTEADATSGDLTIACATPNQYTEIDVAIVRKIDVTGNTVTLMTDNISGDPVVLSVQGDWAWMVYDGANWQLIGQGPSSGGSVNGGLNTAIGASETDAVDYMGPNASQWSADFDISGDGFSLNLVDATSGAITATCTTPNQFGEIDVAIFRKIDSSENAVTLFTDNVTSDVITLVNEGDWAWMVNDGEEGWQLIGQGPASGGGSGSDFGMTVVFGSDVDLPNDSATVFVATDNVVTIPVESGVPYPVVYYVFAGGAFTLTASGSDTITGSFGSGASVTGSAGSWLLFYVDFESAWVVIPLVTFPSVTEAEIAAAITPGTADNVLTSDGSGSWVSAAPTAGTVTAADIATAISPGTAANVMTSDGSGDWVSDALPAITAAEIESAITPGTADNVLTSDGSGHWASAAPTAPGSTVSWITPTYSGAWADVGGGVITRFRFNNITEVAELQLNAVADGSGVNAFDIPGGARGGQDITFPVVLSHAGAITMGMGVIVASTGAVNIYTAALGTPISGVECFATFRYTGEGE